MSTERLYILKSEVDKLRSILDIVKKKIQNASESESQTMQEFCNSIEIDIDDVISLFNNLNKEVDTVEFKDLSGLEKIGEGAFGYVFKAKLLNGPPVAVKVLKKSDQETTEAKKEMDILRTLAHDNVVAYRGTGHLPENHTIAGCQAGQRYFVMEYIELNLAKYVEKQKMPDVQKVLGLPASTVWDLTKQITHGMQFLHSKRIAHRDLKPDNILIDTTVLNMRIKLADFGLAHGLENFKGSSSSVQHVRWRDPHLKREKRDIEDYKKGDVFSFAQVVVYMLTGEKPFSTEFSSSLEKGEELNSSSSGYFSENASNIKVSSHIENTPLDYLIIQSRKETLNQRPSFDEIAKKYFEKKENPYASQSLQAEFFSCGFLQDTKIFVADSLVSDSYEGLTKLNQIPKGYKHECIRNCSVECQKKEKGIWALPPDCYFYRDYIDKHEYYLDKADKKEIDNNKTVALKKMLLDREGDEEEQNIELSFSESTYCHHRTMRDIWKNFNEENQRKIVPCKGDVNPYYSNSFGLHVAVLTNDNPKKFIFTKRSSRPGMASPGTYTCGIVESTSIKDYTDEKEDKENRRISLINTAARGLLEELGIELNQDDTQAICLTTIYLKFDNHEWGMCGFVDLTDERICPDHRLNFAALKSRFTSGPKDKFEHEKFEAVDFEIEPMVKFIRANYKNFASSTKLVVVKVMQAFFGAVLVEKALQAFQAQ